MNKMDKLRSRLKEWNTNEFGDLNIKSENLKNRIHEIDLISEERQLTETEKEKREKTRADFWACDRLRESLWRQKSRAKWVKQGDRNTRFFQAFANNRFRRNFIGTMEVNGTLIENHEQIKEEAENYYKSVFSNQNWSRPRLGGGLNRQIQELDLRMLESPFLMEEIVATVKECDSFKAPGPDGYNMAFVKKSWNVIKNDVFKFFQEFHANGILCKGINSIFVTLIPKIEGAARFKDYRPISMIGWLYKLLAKVLANRFKRVVPYFVGETQAAFICGRHILDGVLIANEIIDNWKKNNSSGVIIKLDFEKAYDCVNWSFLFKLLALMGCGKRWIGWIKSCISSATLAILINGSPSKYVHMEKGLKQGDPIAPLLFNIVPEGLNIMLENAKEANLISGVQMGSNGPVISHLQFADDTMKGWA